MGVFISRVTSAWETAAVDVTIPVNWSGPTPLATNPLVPKLQLL